MMKPFNFEYDVDDVCPMGEKNPDLVMSDHETDDETISASSKGSSSSKLSKSSKSSRSSKSSKSSKKNKQKSKGNDEATSERNMKKKKRQHAEESHTEPIMPSFQAAEVFKTNARKLQTLVALKKIFGIDSEELVEREKKCDLKYKRRSMDLDTTFMGTPEYQNAVYDWNIPLFHEPPSTKEVINLKSSIATGKNGDAQKQVRWPSAIEALCQVTSIIGYNESMIDSCFYKSSDFNNFRLEKFIEDHADEYEWVTSDEEEDYEYEEIIEEEIVYEYYEEEVIEEIPVKTMTSRRTSM